jgi:type IV pilus assembly protein PilW
VARGVTLIELMVGLVIGMIATVVIAQVLGVAEGQKRATTSGSDAQVNGALSLYTLQRDIGMAGYGFASVPSDLGCDTHGAGGKTWTLAPVQITDGANGAPDTILVTTAVNTTGVSLPTVLAAAAASNATDFQVSSIANVHAGDLMIAVPLAIDANNWCSVFTVASTSTVGTAHHVIATTATGPGQWSPTGILPAAGYGVNAYLVDAGQLEQHQYSIDTARYMLQESTLTTVDTGVMGAPSDLYPNIVNLQAMYGKDTDGDNAVDTYDNVTPTTAAGWALVRTIRIAVVAQSGQYEKEEVTSSDPLWNVGGTTNPVTGASACGASQCLALDVQHVPNWKHYRYKVYEMVMPVRNVLW